MVGSKAANWRGGLTSENILLRQSSKYAEWRLSVFERDNFTCQMEECDGTEKYLEAHHIKKFSTFPRLRLEKDNGITLCKKCHGKTKGKELSFQKKFELIINKKFPN